MRYKIYCRHNILLHELLTNSSFVESFDGENPPYPVGGKLYIDKKQYRITKFRRFSYVAEIQVATAA
ncbi:hypothetical protein [Nitrosopumilus sp.]|uniref:hypothetical protein n=1 Tax=Nitrosopumilus sp. TaxID=2024843 RepID=UPI00292F9384|nr:hypothetical protein [Nitrosopumilus sp.]